MPVDSAGLARAVGPGPATPTSLAALRLALVRRVGLGCTCTHGGVKAAMPIREVTLKQAWPWPLALPADCLPQTNLKT